MKTTPSKAIFEKEDYKNLLKEINDLENANKDLKNKLEIYEKTISQFKSNFIFNRYELGEVPLFHLNVTTGKLEIFSQPKINFN